MLLISGGLFWFGQISPDGSFLSDILGPSLLAAVGLGFAFVPQTIAAVSGVEEREAGLASGLINTSQQVGGALGLALLSTVAFTQIDDAAAAAGGAPSLAALTDGYADAFMVGSGDRAARGGGDAGADPRAATARPTSRSAARPPSRPARAESCSRRAARSAPPAGSLARLSRR